MLSPDAACSDLVVESAGPGDECPRGATALRHMMSAYQANGGRPAWLLLPEERAVQIWPAQGVPQRLEQAQTIEAGAQFSGLRLELAEISAA